LATIFDVTYTARMEEALDEIGKAAGLAAGHGRFYGKFSQDLRLRRRADDDI